jgi:serine/threonine protein kinase
MIGKIISHYKIIGHIGDGGMGTVYKGIDLKLDRPVAIKFLPLYLTSDPAIKKRFHFEAKAASSLQHNNICTIHEIDETDNGRMYLVMDYYRGETLKEKLEKGHLEIPMAINYAIQIAWGLQEAHRIGIVHEDIKPSIFDIQIDLNAVYILTFSKKIDLSFAKADVRHRFIGPTEVSNDRPFN